jgi:hypothetical protein
MSPDVTAALDAVVQKAVQAAVDAARNEGRDFVQASDFAAE